MTSGQHEQPAHAYTLRYGAGASLDLRLPADALVALCEAPRGESLADVAGAVDRMLAEPIGYPPLAKACLPGDKVVLALAADVPQAATIVDRAVAALVAAGVEPADITLLRVGQRNVNGHDRLAELCGRLNVANVLHDPLDRQALGYLAASAAGDPIYVNRALHEADLAVSIDCLRLAESLDYHGINSAVFPTFADADSQKRHRLARLDEPGQRARLHQAADEASRLLGVHFTIQVVPGRGDDVLHVLAGEVEAVLREGDRRCHAAWDFTVPKRAALVIATIEGAGAQTWDNLARALASAAYAVQDDGAVAVCSELAGELGPAIKRLVGCENAEAMLRSLGKQHFADSAAAVELVRAMARGKVYLLSQLDDELVEDLGLTPLEASQLSRLAARYGTCTVVTNAQHTVAHTATDVPAPRPATSHGKRQ